MCVYIYIYASHIFLLCAVYARLHSGDCSRVHWSNMGLFAHVSAEGPGQRKVEQTTFNSQQWVCVSYSLYKNDIMSLYSLYNLCIGHVFRWFLNSLNPTCVFIMDAEMGDAHTAISKVGWKRLGGWVLLLKDMDFIEYAINEVRSWAERDSKRSISMHFRWTNQR